jgi:hypothetical protein
LLKAVVNTRSGSTVTIEGSQEEVADLLAWLESDKSGQKKSEGVRAPIRSDGAARSTPAGLLAELIEEGFFSQPKELGEVRLALQEGGHFYPVTTLSPLMLRLVRKKQLRRIKDKKRWTYRIKGQRLDVDCAGSQTRRGSHFVFDLNEERALV